MPIGHYPTYQIFKLPFVSCPSFVCMSASGLPFYRDDTRCAFKNKTDYMLNYPQNLHCLYCQTAITPPIRYFKLPHFVFCSSFTCLSASSLPYP